MKTVIVLLVGPTILIAYDHEQALAEPALMGATWKPFAESPDFRVFVALKIGVKIDDDRYDAVRHAAMVAVQARGGAVGHLRDVYRTPRAPRTPRVNNRQKPLF